MILIIYMARRGCSLSPINDNENNYEATPHRHKLIQWLSDSPASSRDWRTWDRRGCRTPRPRCGGRSYALSPRTSWAFDHLPSLLIIWTSNCFCWFSLFCKESPLWSGLDACQSPHRCERSGTSCWWALAWSCPSGCSPRPSAECGPAGLSYHWELSQF